MGTEDQADGVVRRKKPTTAEFRAVLTEAGEHLDVSFAELLQETGPLDEDEIQHSSSSIDESVMLHVRGAISSKLGDDIIPATDDAGNAVVLGHTDLSVVYAMFQQSEGDFRKDARRVLKLYKNSAIRKFGSDWMRDEGKVHQRCFDLGINTPRIYDYGAAATNDLAYIFMDFIEGTCLKKFIEDQKPGDQKKILGICSGLLDDIARMNRERIYHLDMKPENVIVECGTSRPVTFDFGYAVDYSDIPERKSCCLKDLDMIWGSPSYIAPEFLFGKHLNRRTDLYPVGLILYKAVTGKTPYEWEGITMQSKPGDFLEMKKAELRLSHPLLPGYPADIVRVINKCLSQDPGYRYPSTEHAAGSLRNLLG